MKKFTILLSLLMSACVVFAGCGQNGDNNDTGKTIFDRAQELSEYYDAVPESYNQLIGADESSATEYSSATAASEKISAKSRIIAKSATPASNKTFTPENRPRPYPDGIISVEAYYNVGDVEQMIRNAKEWANISKAKFTNPSPLNVWIGNKNDRAERLGYDKQYDKISTEELLYDTFEYGGGITETRLTYWNSTLFLGKNHKINFRFEQYSYNFENKTASSYFYEYVEDDYYYYIYNSQREDAMSYIIYVDLSVKPYRVFQANGTFTGFDKTVNVELESGKKITYVEQILQTGLSPYTPNCKFYDENGDIIFSKSDSTISVDLWQLSGWTSLEADEDYWNQFELVCDNGNRLSCTSDSVDVIFENEDVTVKGEALYHGNFADENCRYSLVFNYKDSSLNTYENLVSILGEMGLTLKNDYSEVFDEYCAASFTDCVENYKSKKIDYKGMDFDSYIALLNTMDATAFMENFIAEYEETEVLDYVSGYVNEAYEMLDSSLTGSATVSFTDFSVDLSDLQLVIPDSVLHIDGAAYGFNVGLYNGSSFIELASSDCVYGGADMVIQTSGTVTLKREIQADSDYILIAYAVNSIGVRCSEIFYPEVLNDGSREFTDGSEDDFSTYRLTVKNGALVLSKT